MTDRMTAIERGTYAKFALATPNDGDKTIIVFCCQTCDERFEDSLAPGFYWTNSGPAVYPHGPYAYEEIAIHAAKFHYGYDLREPALHVPDADDTTALRAFYRMHPHMAKK